jgi:hypothetical protein
VSVGDSNTNKVIICSIKYILEGINSSKCFLEFFPKMAWEEEENTITIEVE